MNFGGNLRKGFKKLTCFGAIYEFQASFFIFECKQVFNTEYKGFLGNSNIMKKFL